MNKLTDHEYAAFLSNKKPAAAAIGIADIPVLKDYLKPHQRLCVEFALRQGRSGVFLDTGLGKTAIELEWAMHAAEASNGRALILTPLAVARQMEREAHRFGYEARVIREAADIRDGINICNFDRLDRIDPDAFGVVALDESSILKSFTGKTTRALIAAFAGHRFKMAATATPAPNDHIELGNHAEFLSVMDQSEMLIRWFINDSGDTGTWRLKGHAQASFWDWMTTWCRMAESPADFGFDASEYVLPPLNVHRHSVETHAIVTDGLFAGIASATEMHTIKRQTVEKRAERMGELVAQTSGPWVVWCDTDYEADALIAAMPEAMEVRGSHDVGRKEESLAAFADGQARVLITKPAICGYGLNWQHCSNVGFVGRSFSYESWYQAVRRCWRFGQRQPVNVHLIVAEGEDQIGRVIDRKAGDHSKMKRAMSEAMRRAAGRVAEVRKAYEPNHNGRLPAWL